MHVTLYIGIICHIQHDLMFPIFGNSKSGDKKGGNATTVKMTKLEMSVLSRVVKVP